MEQKASTPKHLTQQMSQKHTTNEDKMLFLNPAKLQH